MKTAAERRILPVTLGSAGHIDHGKTSLLRALAGGGTDTDRLAEEQARGLTIDVGYAELVLDDGVEVGVVDVPGHEKFVRNMVAGATGIDVVLFVVAADDGVMPQTREHLQIMSLLGLTEGVIALTKADLVDDDLLALVRSDVEQLVRGTFLEGKKAIPVSAVTGAGLAELRAEVTRLVRAAPRRDDAGFFRMPILRTFTSQGFGTIVTGIPASGKLAVGDRVTIEPGGRAGRVRGLQVYHRPADEAHAGHRTAVNVADVDHKGVRRGDVLCTPGVFRGASLLDVKVSLLPTVPRPVRHNQEVRLHVGTLEAAARVLLFQRKELRPGERSWAQLKLDREAVTAPGDRFILRVPDLLVTLGGGVVLGEGEIRGKHRAALREADFEERERALTDLGVAVASHIRRAWLRGTTRAAAAMDVKRRAEEIDAPLAAMLASGAAADLGRGLLVHADAAAAGCEAILREVERFHARTPLAMGMRKASLPETVGAEAPVVDGLLERMHAARQVEPIEGGRIRAFGRTPPLSDAQQERCGKILAALLADPWQTPREDELPGLVAGPPSEVAQLLDLLEEQGSVVRFKDGVILHGDTVASAKERIAERIRAAGSVGPGDLKELLGATRKYSIPLLEHLDAVGFTRRQGDKRVLR